MFAVGYQFGMALNLAGCLRSLRDVLRFSHPTRAALPADRIERRLAARVTDPAQSSVAVFQSLRPRALGAFLLVQPSATVFLQALPATLFMYLASSSVKMGRLSLLFLAVTSIYGAIGALNDYCDYPLDKTAKPGKPLVRGLVSFRFALWQMVVLATIGMALSFALNWQTACFSALILALGIWYDVRAKRSLWSWVPYAVGIPTLPVWGFAAAGRFERVLLLAYPLGALLSLALNMSNTLPDWESDVSFGLRALTHRLKLRQAILLSWALYAAAIAGFALTGPVVGNKMHILMPGLAGGMLILLFMIADYAMFRSRSLKRGWYAGGFLAMLVGLAWVASLPFM